MFGVFACIGWSIAAFYVGCLVGLFTAALCVAAGRADDATERRE